MKSLRLFSLIFLSFFSTTFAANDVVPLDKIVAVVNNDVITATELNREVSIVKRQMQPSANVDNATLRKQVLDQLIYRDLQLQLAKRNDLSVTDEQLNRVLGNIAAQNHLTPEQLKTAVQQQGVNYNDYLKQIRDEILVSQVQQRALGPTITMNDAEIKAFMQQAPGQPSAYNIIDLLLPLPASPSQRELNAAQKKAAAARIQLQQGANLQTLAKAGWQISDLGWRTATALPDLFDAQVQKMQLNDISEPVRAPNGLHLLKLAGVKNAQSLTRQQAEQLLFQKKLAEKVKPWLEQLRKSAYVKVEE